MIQRTHIAGLILAGGEARRMGGVDKGLLPLHGRPLTAHVIDRLQAQTGWLAISANRHEQEYAAFGLPVFADAPEWQGMGPLAGLASLMDHLPPHIKAVQTAPCDTPFLPADLTTCLADALHAQPDARAAYPLTVDGAHPSLCLVRVEALPTLPTYLTDGGRRLRVWLDSCRAIAVEFDQTEAFINVNDRTTLQRLESV